MVKISRAPDGLYTAKQACQRLNMKQGTFFYHVRTGKIGKVVAPGSVEGYYRRDEIDALAQAQELFMLQYAVSPTTYQRAATEDDIRGIVDLCIAIYGQGGTPSLEARLEIWQKFPDAYYIVKQGDIVVAYVSMIWFNDKALTVLMGEAPKPTKATPGGAGVYSVISVENMIPFTPGKPIESIFISLGVRPGLTNSQQRRYGFKILRDTINVLEDFARQKMPVRQLHATSERQDGIKLGRDMGMVETKFPGDSLLRFSLNLETADVPVARNYQQLMKELGLQWAPITRPEPQPTPQIVKRQQRPERTALWSQEAITANEQSPIVPFADFFKQHGIPESTARRGMGTLFSIAPGGPWIIGGFQVKQVLDLQGQREFYEAYHSKDNFTPCARCPHTTL